MPATIKNKGFSLIELLIVVAIILIIAAIAIPNLLRARRSANEGSATASMRTLGSGELLYRSTNGNFTNLTGLSGDSIIDNVLGSGTKSGYVFSATPGTSTDLQFTAHWDSVRIDRRNPNRCPLLLRRRDPSCSFCHRGSRGLNVRSHRKLDIRAELDGTKLLFGSWFYET